MAKKPMSKIVAIFFSLLMLGSVIGIFLGIILNKEEKVEVPQNKIIKYRLTEAQTKELLNNYYTVIEYEYPSGCYECGSMLTSLEQWTMSSDNQIYLQEIQTDTSSSIKLTITSLRGQEILHNPSQEDARNDICELLISRSLFCVSV